MHCFCLSSGSHVCQFLQLDQQSSADVPCWAPAHPSTLLKMFGKKVLHRIVCDFYELLYCVNRLAGRSCVKLFFVYSTSLRSSVLRQVIRDALVLASQIWARRCVGLCAEVCAGTNSQSFCVKSGQSFSAGFSPKSRRCFLLVSLCRLAKYLQAGSNRRL